MRHVYVARPRVHVFYYPEKRSTLRKFYYFIKPCVTYYDPPRITVALDLQDNSRGFENNLTVRSRVHGTTNPARRAKIVDFTRIQVHKSFTIMVILRAQILEIKFYISIRVRICAKRERLKYATF